MAKLSILDSILFGVRRIFWGATEMPERPAVRFTGDGVSVADNVADNVTEVTIGAGAGAVPTTRKLLVSGGLTVSPVDGVLDEDLTFGLSGINDAQHGSRAGGTLHALATTSAHGFMSATDKTKLDGLPAVADVATITYVDDAIAGIELTPGPEGPPGPTGPTGPAGATGPTGPAGVASASTPLRLSGTALDWYPTADVAMNPDGTARGFTNVSGFSGPTPTITATTGPLTLSPTTHVDITRTSIGNTPSAGIRLRNTTAAVSSGATVQLPPHFEQLGQAWVSGASSTRGVRWRAIPRTSGAVSLVIEYTTNGGSSWSTAFGWDTSNTAIFNEGFWANNYYVAYNGNIWWENGGARLSCGYAQGLRIYSYETADPLLLYSEFAILAELATGEQFELGPELCQIRALQTEVVQLTSNPQVVNHASAGTRTLDLSLGQNWEITLAANITSLVVTNAKRGARIAIMFQQDGTGGRAVTFSGSFGATTAMQSALSSTANEYTSYLFGVNDAGLLVPLSAPYSFAT